MTTVLVTGANRGIGLEFTRQYAADGWRVLACCRDPKSAADLNQVTGDVSIVALDVNDDGSVAAARHKLNGESLDLLINNAGVIGQRGARFGDVDYDNWRATMETNLYGPTRVIATFQDLVMQGKDKKIATVSSRMGSIGENKSNDSIIYRSSKAAVNMVMKCVANELAAQGVICISFHPGWVSSDMGGDSAPVTPQQSAQGMRKVLAGISAKDNGCFFNYDGAEIEW